MNFRRNLRCVSLTAGALLAGGIALGLTGCQSTGSAGLQADASRQDEATVASEKVQRMDRGIPEGAASNPQNDAGFARPPASEGSFGPNPVP